MTPSLLAAPASRRGPLRISREVAAAALQAFAIVLALALPAAAAPPLAPEAERVELIRVDKSERLLMLMRGGEIVRTYRVALGPEPLGHKRRSGDGRTPVGRYHIDWRNPDSEFHLSLRISYPDAFDRADARSRGVDPGGFIMIHGDGSRRDVEGLLDRDGDWTEGCIAVTDDEIEEIWSLTPEGVAVEIRD